MSCMFHVSCVVHTCYMWVVDVRLWMSMCCVLLSICIVCLRERPVTTLSGVIPARSFQANEFSWPIKKQQMKFVNVLPQETFPAAHCWGPKFRFQLCFSAMCCLCVVFRHIVELVWLCFLLCFCVKNIYFCFCVCVTCVSMCSLAPHALAGAKHWGLHQSSICSYLSRLSYWSWSFLFFSQAWEILGSLLPYGIEVTDMHGHGQLVMSVLGVELSALRPS